MDNKTEDNDFYMVDDLNSKKKLIALEYPGQVNNVDNMMDTLGGEEAVSRAFNVDKKLVGSRLQIRFRSDDPYCKHTVGDGEDTCGLLIKVFRKRKSDNEYSYRVEILGTVNTIYKFKNLCDYQYLPISNPHESGPISLYDDLVPKGLPDSSFLDNDVPLFLPPPFFSRFETIQKYCYRRKPAGEEETGFSKAITHFRSNRIVPSIFVKFEDEAVPNGSEELENIPNFSNKFYDKALYAKVKELFDERPVWTRTGLECQLAAFKSTLPTLRYILPRIGYYCVTGPWLKGWIRFGYDPKKEEEARKYQVLDFRVPTHLAQKMRILPKRSYIRKDSTSYSRPTASTANNMFSEGAIARMEDTGEKLTEIRKDNEFFPDLVPTQRNILYQYCDIHIEEIHHIIHCPVEQGITCTKEEGWFKYGTEQRIRDLILKALSKLEQNINLNSEDLCMEDLTYSR